MEPLPLNSAPTKPWQAVGASFRHWPIRRKLFVAFLAVFTATFMLNWAASGWLLARVVQRLVEKELESSTQVLESMVKMSVDTSIASYLRGIAEKNTELVAALQARVQIGEMDEATARRHAAEVLLTQRIGNSGYIYVLDGKGIIRVHPKAELRGADLTGHAFIREQMRQHHGYLEYQWANPGEVQSRPKALYMTYFAPWDWIISVSSYRTEFRHLVKTSDFRARILDLRFGETGYPYLMDAQGTLLVHPSMEGKNILQSRDSSGREFIREMVEKKNGRIIYPWQNPDESVAREKLVVFRYIPEMDWIIASSSYLEEFNRATDQFAWIMGGALLLSLLLAGAATFAISRSLTRPLMNLTARVSHVGNGSLELLPVDSADEVGELAATINGFLTRIQHSQSSLEASELRHRRLFENAVEGIFQSTPAGRFMAANPSMAHILGYASAEAFLQQVGNSGAGLFVDVRAHDDLWRQLGATNVVRDFQTEFRTQDGHTIWVKINARAVRSGENIDYLEGFLTDVT
ncbi:MAG: cache domain-containing protein [Rhodoferax sp.]|nr:cache domain-containing protein [Rhodoferax sp.]